jgi:glycosyltransferase involved in cell wall biosynthesis
MDEPASPRIAVVVPAYRVKAHILALLSRIGPEVTSIYVVDDCCPEESGKLVAAQCVDRRVTVLYHEQNQGVGGAVTTGYKRALEDDAEIVIKLDGDGQMDPALIPFLIQPILAGQADYTKGNRFFELDDLQGMPFLRLIGNAGLSFLTKLSSGYYSIFDPNNGYTAIHAKVLARLRLDRIHKRYFFESDMLFHLGQLRAAVLDVPMKAVYGAEVSSLSVTKSLFTFGLNHLKNIFRRIFYSYYLRDFNPASVNLMAGVPLAMFGLIFGILRWYESGKTGEFASTGDIMLAVLPFLLGIQFLLSFFAFDSQNSPTLALHPRLSPKTKPQPQPKPVETAAPAPEEDVRPRASA